MTNIYVGNLPFSTTEEEVRNMFSAYGAVDNVSLIADRETGAAARIWIRRDVERRG